MPIGLLDICCACWASHFQEPDGGFRFLSDGRHLPVLWHQCLLVFVQRYKEDMSSEQKESLFELMRKHNHDKITPEIRRELVNSKCRDVELAEPPNVDEMMS